MAKWFGERTIERMQRAVATLFALVLPFPILVSAQTNAYRLHEPTVEEYLAALPDVLNVIQPNIIPAEIEYRYTATLGEAPSALLYPAIDAFTRHYRSLDAYDVWWEAVILNWIRENEVDLSRTSHLDIAIDEVRFNPTYGIDVREFDFNGDGRYSYDASYPLEDISLEYVLEVDSELFIGYIIIAQTEDGYQLIPTPLPASSTGFVLTFRDPRTTQPVFLDIGDYNRNGLPEWAVTTGCFRANLHWGDLYLLEWRNGEMVNVVPHIGLLSETTRYAEPLGHGANDNWGCAPSDVQWDFVNLDNDLPSEVLQRQRYRDNWSCDLVETKIFNWNPAQERYEFERVEDEFAESAGCALRFAQEYVWASDYVAAIPILEETVKLFAEQDGMTDWEKSRAAYAQVQLALAYSMIGKGEYAAAIVRAIQPLNTEFRIGEPIPHLVDELQRIDVTDAKSFCQTMYDVFRQYFIETAWNGDTYWGTTENIYVPGDFNAPQTVDPAHAGCPVPNHEGPLQLTADGNYSPVSPEPTIEDVNLYFDYGLLYEALVEVNSYIDTLSDNDATSLQEAYYWRAFILEAVDIPDDALHDYVQVVTIAPNGAWGQLAALHLEPVTDSD